MVELSSSHRKPTKNRGFYVRMRILNHNIVGRHGRAPQSIEKSFCYRYFKWVLWISLSLYFLSSFLITHNNKPTPSLSKTTILPQSKASRALFESLNSSASLSLPSVHQGQFQSLKLDKNRIFICMQETIFLVFLILIFIYLKIFRFVQGIEDIHI